MLVKKIIICLFFCPLILPVLSAQEALKSSEEEYYGFLALQGLAQRPALNYRTLSDSKWNIADGEHPWQEQNLGIWHDLFGDFRIRAYGPELFMSGNTAAPYGQNDGVLWQGRGFNALLKGGVRFEGYGVELTLLPHFSFSQNADFDIMPSSYDSKYGYFWGYIHNIGADAPQRFGDKPFFDWDAGDSEIRYTWKTLTIGFGTQAIWLGPAYLNPILHSNNAPTYPKFDIGLRRQKVKLPWLGWDIGDVEARLWVGRLTESDYFDNDDTNNHTMIHGLSFAYVPSFLHGVTLFANRVCLVPWAWENLKYIFPSSSNTIEDQKSSFGFSWIIAQTKIELFGEIGIDDFTYGGLFGYARYPFWTMVYTIGLKKNVSLFPEKKIYGQMIIELNWLERTQSIRQPPTSYTFYFHHQLVHGYTNEGQWLGNGVTPGGNSQSLGFILYYPKGNTQILLNRNNPDNNFLYCIPNYGFVNYWANFNVGANTKYFFNPFFSASGGLVYNLIINRHYIRKNEIIEDDGYRNIGSDTHLHNFSFNFSVKFSL